MKKIILGLTLILISINLQANDYYSIKDLFQSSFLKDTNILRYQVHNLFDGDYTTPWVEGKSDSGISEYIEITFSESIKIDEIRIAHGFFDDRYYLKNNRVKEMNIKSNSNESTIVQFEDQMDLQSIYFENIITTDNISFHITDIYRGSTWDDTCISEIEFYYDGHKIQNIREESPNILLTSLTFNQPPFDEKFVDDIWQSNLPINSQEALQIGYEITDQWTGENAGYAARYGFESVFICKNKNTEITFWENKNSSIIWEFHSTDISLVLFDMVLLNKDVEKIITELGLPSKITPENIEYRHKDFGFSIFFDKRTSIKVDFERYL